MNDDDATTPRHDPLRFLDSELNRTRTLWFAAALALGASIAAVFVSGTIHRFGSVLLNLAFVTALLVIMKYPIRERVNIDDVMTIKTPRQRILGYLQAILLLLYNAGIMVVMFGVFISFGLFDLHVDPDALAWFPVGLAGYLVILGLVSQMHVQEYGRVGATWYSRASLATTWVLAVLVFAVGVVMLWVPFFRIGAFVFGETELLVAVLVVGLSVATSMFFVAGIPTAYDLIIKVLQRNEKDVEKSQTPPLVYATLVAVGAMAIVGFIITRLGIIEAVGGALSSEQGAYILILLPVALAAFGLYSSINIYRQGRIGLYKKRIPTKLRNDIVVFGTSSVMGGFFSVASFMVITGRWTSIGPFETDLDTAKDLIMITILSTVGPIGLYMSRQARRLDSIELRLPDFLNDLAETRRAGLTLTNSLHTSARSDYGPLTDEVRLMSNQVSWGVSFADALNMFSKRVKSSLVERSTNLIVESAKTGGSVAAILKAAADDAREIKSLETERKSTLATYLVVIYVTFFVFMVVIAVLDNAFIPQVIEAQNKILSAEGTDGAGGLADAISGVKLDQEALRFTYFNAAVIQAIGNGMVGGLLIDQRITSGFRHVAIMAFTAWIVFRWLLAF